MKTIQNRKKLCAILVMALYALSMVLSAVPATSAATPTITLTPTSQTPGASVTVTGTGFGATTAVGIGFGAEVQVSNEWMNITGPFDVGNGPYTGFTTRLPIKPTTFRISINISSTTWFQTASDVAGNGTLNNGLPSGNVTLNYVTGNWTRFTTSPVSSSPFYKHICNYTTYEYNVTPVAGVTTSASGSFTANITVPAVASGNYNVTAIDSAGNRAASSLSVGASSAGWSKTYGGANTDAGFPDVIQTSDGGYAIVGATSLFGAGMFDAYLVKTGSAGNMQWNKTYGGPLNETGFRICSTIDGGYAIIGTNSYGAAGNDAWLVKTDAAGNMLWNKTYGGTGDDTGASVKQTADGGYAIAGYTSSFGAGNLDFWLVKTDAVGNMQWNKTYGFAGSDYGSALILTSDGGYAIVGYSTSFGGYKAWLVKTDSSGNVAWNKTYGIGAISWVASGIQTADGGYALSGATYPALVPNTYLVKTDSSGNMLWNKTYGGTGTEKGGGLVQMAEGGYAVVSETDSFGAGGMDGWLFRTDSSGNMLWNKTFGGSGKDNTNNIVWTADGGFAMAGYTNSSGSGNSELWLIKTDASGVVPEGFAIGVIMLLSSIAALIGTLYFRKPPKIAK